MIWAFRGRQLSFERVRIMGILNITPDSFSDGGRYLEPAQAEHQAAQMIEEGADLLDLGAESTRPGAQIVSEQEELRRLLPAVRKIRKAFQVPISIDTTKPEVARQCLEEGADIINDVSGLQDSGPAMAEIVRKYEAGLILMHRRGNAQTMQSLAVYQDEVAEVLAELKQSVEKALAAGIAPQALMLDPGIGFAKTPEQSIRLLQCLERFHEAGYPLMTGVSRKSFLGTITGRDVQNREFATASALAVSVLKGVHAVRVHQVRAAVDAVRVAESLRGDVSYVRTFKMGNH